MVVTDPVCGTNIKKARAAYERHGEDAGGRSLFARVLRRAVRQGTLTVVYPNGGRDVFGAGAPHVAIRINDPSLPWRTLFRPSLVVGEAYMEGALTIEEGSVRDLLSVTTSNVDALFETWPIKFLGPVAGAARLLQQYNPIWRSRANVAYHYDLSRELFRLFLDDDLQYSCAYFATGQETLEEAQARKKLHIAAKLLLQPGMRVLDIGSGWGGLAIDLARRAEVDVTGITLSPEQARAAIHRASLAGVGNSVRFELRDYRQQAGQFDRIVSVGMFEHVGAKHYTTFFECVRRMLKTDGVAVLHAIGRMGPPGGTDPWIRKYIFPGGYCPALSEVLSAIERTGLWINDIEILRLHYAETLRHWFERFQKNRDRARALYDERFCRMWEFYLAGCEMMFRNSSLMVFQIQLSHHKSAVPQTRDYMFDFERQQPPAWEATHKAA